MVCDKANWEWKQRTEKNNIELINYKSVDSS